MTGKYKYQEIVDELTLAIERGEYRDRLPSVRALGEIFQVNNRTILRSLQELSAQGMILQHGNQGFQINRPDRRRPVTGNIITYTQNLTPVPAGWEPAPDRMAEMVAAAGKRLIAMHSMSPEVCSMRGFWESLAADGVIFFNSSLSEDAAYQLKLSGVPFVTANRVPREWGVNYVDFDHETALRKLFTSLVQARHRRIAMINSRYRLGYFREYFLTIYRDFMEQYAFFDPELFCYPESECDGETFLADSLRKLLALKLPPSAIYLGVGLPQEHLAAILETAKIRIPDGIRLYSASSLGVWKEEASGVLPGLRYDYSALKRNLWELLEEVMSEPGMPPQGRLIEVEVSI